MKTVQVVPSVSSRRVAPCWMTLLHVNEILVLVRKYPARASSGSVAKEKQKMSGLTSTATSPPEVRGAVMCETRDLDRKHPQWHTLSFEGQV